MIESKDLRRGNLLLHTSTGSIVTVVEIKENSNRCSYIRTDNGTPHISIIANEYLEPIPLTEEILLKCGFDNNYSIDIKCGKKKISFQWGSRIISTGYRSNWRCNRYKHIKYLHQLQNFFYSLCGKELEVNL